MTKTEFDRIVRRMRECERDEQQREAAALAEIHAIPESCSCREWLVAAKEIMTRYKFINTGATCRRSQ